MSYSFNSNFKSDSNNYTSHTTPTTHTANMKYSMVSVAAMASFAAPALADFYIYWGNTISSDPYLGGGYFAAIDNVVSTLPRDQAYESSF